MSRMIVLTALSALFLGTQASGDMESCASMALSRSLLQTQTDKSSAKVTLLADSVQEVSDVISAKNQKDQIYVAATAAGSIFINPATPAQGGQIPAGLLGFIQVLFLGAAYGYLLKTGSSMISDGSELLLLVPSLSGVVGSVVLPVLGAVPDGAIILFSGIGTAAAVQQQLTIGVGALAGSTIMLLTVTFFLSIQGGCVPIVDGKCVYNKVERKKLEESGSLLSYGVEADSSISKSASVMVLTGLLCYLVVEIPALVMRSESNADQAKGIMVFAWIGVAIAGVLFFAYLALQFSLANKDDESGVEDLQKKVIAEKTSKVAIQTIERRMMNLKGALLWQVVEEQGQQADKESLSKSIRSVAAGFFKRCDKDGSGRLSRAELQEMLYYVGERVSNEDFNELFTRIDTDKSGCLDLLEISEWLSELLLQPSGDEMKRIPSKQTDQAADAEEVAEDDDEPEIPDELRNLSPDEQQRQILAQSFKYMAFGTLLVLLISDPMVDVLSSIGDRTGVPNFYVSFLLAPLASNASEMIASYQYAQKRTQLTISISFAQLLGAACMNNTFCLGIFYLLVALQGLPWTYHAEVASIVVVEIIMGLVAMKKYHSTLDSYLVLSLFPLSLAMVYGLNVLSVGK